MLGKFFLQGCMYEVVWYYNLIDFQFCIVGLDCYLVVVGYQFKLINGIFVVWVLGFVL